MGCCGGGEGDNPTLFGALETREFVIHIFWKTNDGLVEKYGVLIIIGLNDMLIMLITVNGYFTPG